MRSSEDRSCGGMFEALESRVLLAVTFDFDYSLDTNGFFNDPARREALEWAGEWLTSRLSDSLDEIEPGGPNSWAAVFTHPGTGESDFEVADLTIPQDVIKVFAGGRALTGALGRGGAGGWSASGTQDFLDAVRARGEAGALGPDPSQTDFGPWGGAITFDTGTTWHFGLTTDGFENSEADFVSVALHELIHLLGFSSGVASFANLISGTTFTGSEAMDEYDGAGAVPLSGDLAHWSEGLTDNGQETLMDPSVTTGARKLLTPLDLAALDDIGWDVDLTFRPSGTADAISLSVLTGDGDSKAEALIPGDSDLFEFTAPAAGRGFVQVVVVTGAGLDGSVRVFDEVGVLVASNSAGHIGATADVEFLVDAPGRTYTVEVLGDANTGTYQVRVDAEPMTHVKYYPEGFANDKISEFVSITNPNDFDVTYTVTLRYEDPGLPVDEAVVVMGETVGGGLRAGVTISDKGFRANDLLNGGQVIKNTPYAIIVSSDGPLAVSLSHFDFSIATGESFTDVTSTTWAFPRAERAPGSVNDFVVFYNPNDHAVRVTLTALTFSNVGVPDVTLTQVVQPMRRSGWGFNFEDSLPDGVYGFTLDTEAVDVADAPDHVGIVAALTHFDTVSVKGWGALGDPTDGSSAGVIPSLERGPAGDFEIAFFNPSNISSIVQLSGEYLSGNAAFTPQNLTVPPRGVLYRTGSQLGVLSDEAIGFTYTTLLNERVVVQAQELSFGDGTSTRGATEVGREFVFGDAFINSNKAGTSYFETLSFYNPDSSDLEVTIQVFFNDGVEISTTVTVPGEGFAQKAMHEVQALLDHANLNFFGMRATASSPFAVSQSHFDLFFGSGWGALGAPVGLTTELSLILS